MRALAIRWGFMPPEAYKAVRPVVLRWAGLLPDWCRQLSIYWEDVNAHEAETGIPVPASFSAAWEYRNATLRVHAPWLRCGPDEREETIVHELTHAMTWPMHQTHSALVPALLDPDGARTLRAVTQEQWRMALEAVTQDLAKFLISEGPPARPDVREEHDSDSRNGEPEVPGAVV